LSIEARLMRFNLSGPIFSHVLGYVGQINLEEIEDSMNFSYPLSFQIGKSGVEKSYEEQMRGGVGYKTVEVDVHGKEIRELTKVIPKKGTPESEVETLCSVASTETVDGSSKVHNPVIAFHAFQRNARCSSEFRLRFLKSFLSATFGQILAAISFAFASVRSADSSLQSCSRTS